MEVIKKTDSIKQAEEILDIHRISTPRYWEVVLGMLLDECESHLEVHGYGDNASFTKIQLEFIKERSCYFEDLNKILLRFQ